MEIWLTVTLYWIVKRFAKSPLWSCSIPPITIQKSLRSPKDEVQSVTHEDVLYAPRKFEFSHLHRQKSGDHVWERILRVWTMVEGT